MVKKNKREDNLLSSALVYTIGLVLIKGLGLIGTPIFTNLLSPDAYGTISIFTTWTLVCSTTLGLYTQASLARATIDFSDEKYDAYVSSSLALSCISFVVASVVYYFNLDFFATLLGFSKALASLLLISSFANFLFNFWQVKMMYESRKMTYLLGSFVTSAFSIVCSVIFVTQFSSKPEVSKIAGDFFPSLIFGLVFLAYSLNKGKQPIDFTAWKYCLVLCTPMIFTTLSNIFLSQTDRLMLHRIQGVNSVGLYSFGSTIGEILNFVRLGISNAWIPWSFKKMNEEEWSQIQVMTSFLIRILCILCLGFMFISPEFVKIIGNERYWVATPVIAPIVCGVFFNSLSLFYSSCLIFQKKNIWITISTLVAVFSNVILNIYFIFKFSYMGAAFATMISYMICLLFYGIVTRKVAPNLKIDSRPFLRDSIIQLVGLMFYGLSYNFLLIRWMIALILGGYLLMYLFKNKELLINLK